MYTLPRPCSRRLCATLGIFCDRSALLLVLLLVATLAPLLYWQDTQPLPQVEATVTRLSPKIVTQARGSVQTSTDSTLSASVQSLFRLSAAITAPRGRARHETFYSPALDRHMDYWLYLPPNYNSTERRYPVLYVLHGRGGSSSEWKDYGLFDQADELIRQQQIAPLIIVAPQGDLGYWMNHVGAGPRWGDYISQDLIGYIDANYRTLTDRGHRAIGGISMGGHGAIRLALHHPELFGAAAGHSAVFRSEAEAFPFFGTGADYRQRDPVSLVADRNVPVEFALWLDIGADDPWLPRTRALHELLVQRGIPHSWQLNPGGHEAAYWTSHLRAYLNWYDKALR